MKQRTLTCKACLTDLPIASFTRDKTRSRGYRGDCNYCRNLQRNKARCQPTVRPSPNPGNTGFTFQPTQVAYSLPQLSGVGGNLPEVELLPAAYLKRCADYWSDLVDGNHMIQRLA